MRVLSRAKQTRSCRLHLSTHRAPPALISGPTLRMAAYDPPQGLAESGVTMHSDSEQYSAGEDISTSPPPSTGSPVILYKPPTVWSLFRGAAINLLLPFINGMMLGFGELFASEAAFKLGWGGTKVGTAMLLNRPRSSTYHPGLPRVTKKSTFHRTRDRDPRATREAWPVVGGPCEPGVNVYYRYVMERSYCENASLIHGLPLCRHRPSMPPDCKFMCQRVQRCREPAYRHDTPPAQRLTKLPTPALVRSCAAMLLLTCSASLSRLHVVLPCDLDYVPPTRTLLL